MRALALARRGLLVLAFAVLALLPVDDEIHGWATSPSGWLHDLMALVTRLGDARVITPVAAVAVGVLWLRCRALAVTVAVSVSVQPLVQWLLKHGIGRDRPEGALADSPSFPSGHVLAAVSLWVFLPAAVAAFTDRWQAWRAGAAATVAIVAAVGLSRVVLGRHWPSDVAGGLFFGLLYVVAMEGLLDRLHSRSTTSGR